MDFPTSAGDLPSNYRNAGPGAGHFDTVRILGLFKQSDNDWSGRLRFGGYGGAAINQLQFNPARTWNRSLPVFSAQSYFNGTQGWTATVAGHQYALDNNKPLFIPLQGIVADWSLITSITVPIKPAAARSGTNRMNASLVTIDGAGNLTVQSPAVYDDGTTNVQNLALAAPSTRYSESSWAWYVRVFSGDLISGQDRCYNPEVFFSITHIVGG
jgi:hypothetical protein